MATSSRGFASMDKARQREISRKGGLNSHKNDRNRAMDEDNE
ncbi:KGG domain-containing protein [Patescibacteria group bacterium]|nr:KGG domain-containing protein [Patescibacteria group bacterium]